MMNNSSIICPFVNEKFFEAGVIKWEKWDMGGDGLRILLSGPSGSGKTTLAQSILSDNCILFTNSQIPNTPIYELADFTEKDQGWNLVAVCLDLTVTIENTAGFIKFSFNKDIEDNLGNTMTETLVLSYNKT